MRFGFSSLYIPIILVRNLNYSKLRRRSMRPTRSQLSRPSTAGPRRVRRRSTCLIPASKFGAIGIAGGDPGRLKYDPLAGLPVLRKPVKLRHLRPSLKRFQSGKSSLYSVAYALKQNASAARAVVAHKQQSLLWCAIDQKEMNNQLNEQRRNRPALPEDLSVKIRIARTGIAQLMRQGFDGFQYDGIENVFVFLKVKKFGEEEKEDAEAEGNNDMENVDRNAAGKSRHRRRPATASATRVKRKGILGNIKTSRTSRRFTRKGAEDEDAHLAELQSKINRSNLRNSTVVIWVGAHDVAGFPQRSGLGTAYMSTGREVSGTAALLMRVEERNN